MFCSLSYPPCNANAPFYIVICGLSGCTTYFHISYKTIWFSEESSWTQNVCFDFVYNFWLKDYYSKKNWARLDHKCTHVFIWSTRYSSHMLTRFGFFRLIFENKQTSNFIKILTEGAELFHADRQDSHDEANSRFRQFCESAEQRRANYIHDNANGIWKRTDSKRSAAVYNIP
jgi:hypothetical protein